MIHDEGRLDHLLLAELLKEEVDNVAPLVALLELHIVDLCDCLGLLIGADRAEVHAGVFLHRIDHGQPAERLRHVNDRIFVLDDGASADLLRQIAEHGLGQLHHAIVIGVRLIKLHQRKLRVVTGVHALVPEDAADLIDSFKSADNQTLQIKLQ